MTRLVLNDVFDALCDGNWHTVQELGERFSVHVVAVRAMMRFGDRFEFLRYDKELDRACMSPKMAKSWQNLNMEEEANGGRGP